LSTEVEREDILSTEEEADVAALGSGVTNTNDDDDDDDDDAADGSGVGMLTLTVLLPTGSWLVSLWHESGAQSSKHESK